MIFSIHMILLIMLVPETLPWDGDPWRAGLVYGSNVSWMLYGSKTYLVSFHMTDQKGPDEKVICVRIRSIWTKSMIKWIKIRILIKK